MKLSFFSVQFFFIDVVVFSAQWEDAEYRVKISSQFRCFSITSTLCIYENVKTHARKWARIIFNLISDRERQILTPWIFHHEKKGRSDKNVGKPEKEDGMLRDAELRCSAENKHMYECIQISFIPYPLPHKNIPLTIFDFAFKRTSIDCWGYFLLCISLCFWIFRFDLLVVILFVRKLLQFPAYIWNLYSVIKVKYQKQEKWTYLTWDLGVRTA